MKNLLKENIKFYRQKANLTQIELGKILNVLPTAISNWECGVCPPSSKNLQKLCNVFKVSHNELVLEDKTKIKKQSKFLNFFKKK